MRLTAPGFPSIDLADKACLMGVINVTPDSFSDGGELITLDAVVTRALDMARHGARLLDVGAESTRPGAERVDAEEQIRRAIQPIAAVRHALDEAGHQRVWISIDTTRADVAEAALDAGACFLNDVSAGLDDPRMLELAAERRVPICLMHKQGEPDSMQQAPTYDDVVRVVYDHLMARRQAARDVGVASKQIVLDPGIGFGKTLEHNLALLAALPRWIGLNRVGANQAEGQAWLVGVSRKRMIHTLSPETGSEEPYGRLPGTLALTGYLVAAGVRLLRVHDVRENQQALDVAHALALAGDAPMP